MENILNGFLFTVQNAPGNLIAELFVDANAEKGILYRCNHQKELISLTNCEEEFVLALCDCGIDRLSKEYWVPIDFDPISLFKWSLDCSFDDKHVISEGDFIPCEIEALISVLRKYGSGVPLEKKNPSK